jgi:hypothetical protein
LEEGAIETVVNMHEGGEPTRATLNDPWDDGSEQATMSMSAISSSRASSSSSSSSGSESPLLSRLDILTNAEPEWDPVTKMHSLDFKGRVTKRSTKNFILHAADHSYRDSLLFGRVGEHRFHLDVAYPLSIYQAYCVALAVLDAKIADRAGYDAIKRMATGSQMLIPSIPTWIGGSGSGSSSSARDKSTFSRSEEARRRASWAKGGDYEAAPSGEVCFCVHLSLHLFHSFIYFLYSTYSTYFNRLFQPRLLIMPSSSFKKNTHHFVLLLTPSRLIP